ncbi:polymerase II subunit RPB7 [Seminavis robusta]|uniref:Polymerase II subunit RPB7 n=1 Tax=Seminavis robusta TaxID=568900 RepID=A0A9N8EWE1_9STRA|nr:polymerase II subunit RPB7 [Seminavis robusta]|eukprot:Sro1898_g304120.1 polymerase II subunit RPB7 (204) ;mRNA; r:4382-5073
MYLPPHQQQQNKQQQDQSPVSANMFYVTTLEHEIVLEPVYFGPKLRATIVRLLKEEVEGLALATYGYVVNVIEVLEDQIKSGIIEYDTGNVVFTVKYTALLLRPFINEVLDATVSQCNSLGFFAFVGPLRIFVSKHSMPEDMFNGYDGEKDAWISDDKEVIISSGCGVRLKIKGRTVESGNITAIGTIKDNYLGLVDDGEAAN